MLSAPSLKFLLVLLAACAQPLSADLLLNGGVDIVGSNGNPAVTSGGSGGSAAQSWIQYTVVPLSTITSQLLPTTDPFGSGMMIDISTTAGFYAPASQGNGFYQHFTTVPAAVFTFDIYVVSGTVTGGLVLTTGPFAQANHYSSASWQQVSQTINSPVNEVAFEDLVAGAGAEFYLDNLQVLQVAPEPGTWALLLIACACFFLVESVCPCSAGGLRRR
jgi:hypothetical protein